MDLKTVHEVTNRFQKIIFKNSSYIDSGFFVSSFKGAGLQFKEHQVYNYGDEIRFIDWKLLARKNQPYIKTFEEERNIEVKIIIDCNSNFILGYNGKSKFSSILEMCAVLILFAGKTKDKVSIFFVGKKCINVKGLSGEPGLVKMISRLNSEFLVDDSGKVNHEHYLNFCEDQFSRQKYHHVLREKNGPFILFSRFNDGRYDLLRRIFSNQNTHFFELRCPFEQKKNKFKFSLTGLFGDNHIKENIDKTRTYVSYIDIDDAPLVNFVEGIMSHDKRI